MDNVYSKKKAVSAYKNAAKIPMNVFEKIYSSTFETIPYLQTKKSLQLLDIGVGTGSFILPIAKLMGKHHNTFLDCYDISKKMLEKFSKNIREFELPTDKIFSVKYNAQNGIPSNFLHKYYNIVLMTFVIHYINNWKNLLKKIHGVLKKGGIFILAEASNGLSIIDGEIKQKNINNSLFVKFWATYFDYRSNFSKWNPKIRVSDISIVNDYLKNGTLFKLVKSKQFHYLKNICFNDMLLWIKIGVFSSVGSGLSSKNRDNLAKYMKQWMEKNKVDGKKNREYKLGINLYIYKKI